MRRIVINLLRISSPNIIRPKNPLAPTLLRNLVHYHILRFSLILRYLTKDYLYNNIYNNIAFADGELEEETELREYHRLRLRRK